jgi:diketogulonate reductase-like aldo/keto reductase
MAYSPLGQGALLRDPKLAAIARRSGATPAQIALGWLLRSPDILAIPESADLEHIRDNRAAATLQLDPPLLDAIDAAFSPPTGPSPLSVI